MFQVPYLFYWKSDLIHRNSLVFLEFVMLMKDRSQIGRNVTNICKIWPKYVTKFNKKVCHILKCDKLLKLWPIVTKMGLSHFPQKNCAKRFQIVTNLCFLSQNVTIWAAWSRIFFCLHNKRKDEMKFPEHPRMIISKYLRKYHLLNETFDLFHS